MPEVTGRLSTALAGRYRIERHLGAGGMATVYLAEDLKHKRKVALKVLKPDLAAVLGAERFVQEITTTASLQHPHILPLFDSGTAGQRDGGTEFLYYVMPYVEGETLRDKLDRETQLSIDEAVRIATEVADALDYAHRHGVIHRDIKPENILLHDGRPMVADFGIALAVSAAAGGRMTETGLSLGTPHYMSPEQATAEKDLTNRSDVYSLGAVLFEMLTGDPPHTGSSAQQIIMKIVTDEARPVTELRKSVPPNVAFAVAKSLEKLPADRFATAAAFATALIDSGSMAASAASVAIGAAQKDAPLARGLAWRLAPWVVTVAALGFAASRIGGTSDDGASEVIRYDATPTAGEPALLTATGTSIALSPDGRTLAYLGSDATSGEHSIYLRDRDALAGRKVPGTVGASVPVFSPDGRWLAFLAGERLRKIALDGSGAVTLAQVPGDARGIHWGVGDQIVFNQAAGRAITLVSAAGGSPPVDVTVLSDTSAADHRWPRILPNGKGILLTVFPGSAEQARVAVLELETGEITELTRGTSARYADGVLVLGRVIAGVASIFAAPFDLDGLHLLADPVPLIEDVVVKTGGAGEFAISDNGALTYLAGDVAIDGLSLIGSDGRIDPLPIDLGDYHTPRFSPDGDVIALGRGDASGHDIWLFDIERSVLSRLTFDGSALKPLWSADGETIAYQSQSGGSGGGAIMRIRTDGSAEAERIVESEGLVVPLDWLDDSTLLTIDANGAAWQHTLGSDAEPTAWAPGPAVKSEITVSPDGQWIAYTSNETGQREVYVRPASGTGSQRQISVAGGDEPIWAPDGSTLYYRSRNSMMAVPVTSGVTFRAGDPLELFPDVSATGEFPARAWDIHPDGERFLVKQSIGTNSRLVVVVNWLSEVRARFVGAGDGR